MEAVPPASQPHRSVLYQETIEYLAPKSSGRYLDCTAGAGGHSYGILEASSPCGQLIAIDLDPTAIQLTSERLRPFGQRAIVVHDSYLNAARILQRKGWDKVDGILLDLGVSSMQLDQVERGFSFRTDAPLDMRFDPTTGETAADLVNRLSEKELADVIWKYGEERLSRRIARRIIQNRPVLTTTQLADAVRSAIGAARGRIDPATRTFQAIRIAVNDELHTIEEAIPGLIELLNPKGRLVIISFHSLEDRLVKLAFRRESVDCLCPPEQIICTCGHKASVKILTPRPVVAGEEEVNENLRARSAKLRAIEKK
ncbi:MAG TPA: 16S rRNA (cytosine(1402)-N(4))-methyltransferase RsmH [Anaerolineaceae bacterium]|nr:16S rRNA (cytosine(1402)-N(4))-methyltransferase RsmH [Anaerolineaceae bacterium]